MSLTKPIDLKQLITVVVTIGVSLRNMKHLKMLLCQMYLQTATLMILFPTYITYLGKIIRLHGIKVIPNTVQRYHIAYCWKNLDFAVRLKIFLCYIFGPFIFLMVRNKWKQGNWSRRWTHIIIYLSRNAATV